jgi:hypothetical protein
LTDLSFARGRIWRDVAFSQTGQTIMNEWYSWQVSWQFWAVLSALFAALTAI